MLLEVLNQKTRAVTADLVHLELVFKLSVMTDSSFLHRSVSANHSCLVKSVDETIRVSETCFKWFWGNLCIGQSESLCNVTYSVQFKVPLFLLSAGVGSHRGAVQPLHRRGSDCRGRQRDTELVSCQWSHQMHPEWEGKPSSTRLPPQTQQCHKMRRPHRYEWHHKNTPSKRQTGGRRRGGGYSIVSSSEEKAMDHTHSHTHTQREV